MIMLKVTQKQSFALFSGSVFFEIYSSDKAWAFSNETSILVFAKLAIFHFIKVRTRLGKIVRKITR